MSTLEKTEIQLGYIPLLDCISLLWASHKGYFAEQGLDVSLVKEPSWASLRDRLAFGFLDAAHCLSTILPAAAMGEDHLGIPLQTSLILSQNRAFISLSQKLCHELNVSVHDHPTESAKKIANILSLDKSRTSEIFAISGCLNDVSPFKREYSVFLSSFMRSASLGTVNPHLAISAYKSLTFTLSLPFCFL